MRSRVAAFCVSTSVWALALDATVATAAPGPAYQCRTARVVPRAEQIPVSFPGFAYTKIDSREPTDVRVLALPGGAPVPVKTELADGLIKVTPEQPLTVGARYRVEYDPVCKGAGANDGPFEFTAAPGVPIPGAVATLQGAPAVTVVDHGVWKVTVKARYALADEMKPWIGAYGLAVTVDGRALSTKVTIAGDVVDVEATGWCDEANAATKTHAVALRGVLPFAPTLETAAAQASFDCPAPAIARPAGATSAPPPTDASGSTSGCRASSSSSAPWSAFALVGAAVIVARLRRREGGA